MYDHDEQTSSFLNMLSEIRPRFLQQKEQAIRLTEQMIHHLDLSYIPQILACFPIGQYYLPQLDADMRRLRIICEIIAAEEMLPGAKPVFLENVDSFDDLIQKYIYVTFLLRRLELPMPKEALSETTAVLAKGRISICALRKITECEIFSDPEYVYQRAIGHLSLSNTQEVSP